MSPPKRSNEYAETIVVSRRKSCEVLRFPK
jgi:hypothetical protein